MELVKLTHENLEQEHICCAIAKNKDIQVMSKKDWLKERLDEGLVFLKCNVRGKCFIEYIPAEYAWAPIEADCNMYINCLWVSGQLKGQGHSNLLLDACIEDCKKKGKKGLVVLSSNKKKGFLSDPYFELMHLPFEESVEKPCFRNSVHTPEHMPEGFTLYYTNQCPFTAKYVPLLHHMAQERGIIFQVKHIRSREEAQNAPTPYTTYSLYYNGEFITHEILSEKKFEKILERIGL